MNHSFFIRTKKTLDPTDILDLISEDYPIVVFNKDFPELSLVYEGRSSRAISILKIDNGYEVRLPMLSSGYDFYFVEDIVKLLCDMAFVDGYEAQGGEVKGSSDFFLSQNFEFRLKDDVRFIKEHLGKFGSSIEFPCKVCNIFVGYDYLRRAGVSVTSEDRRFHGLLTAAMAQTLHFLMDKNHNNDDLELHSKKNPELCKTVSLYRYPDDNDIDYFAFGEVIVLEDARSKERIEILYNNFKKIVPQGWTRVDETQFNYVPFTDQTWEEFFNKAKELQWDGSFDNPRSDDATDSEPDSLFNKPSELIGSSFGYDYRDGSHQDFGYSKEDVELLLDFARAIESGTSDYFNPEYLECDLGILYENGIGVEQDCHKAVYWYDRAAQDGDDSARCNLADILRKGTGGVEKDYRRAFEIYKTVEQPYGPFRVGYMYEHGMGVEKDMTMAIKWYKKGSSHFLAAKRLKELGIDPDDEFDFY